MNATCPSCGCEQGAGLLCADQTGQLEQTLRTVPDLLSELDVAISKQARIGGDSGPPGLARERNPMNVGAMMAADALRDVLAAWASEVWADCPIPAGVRYRLGAESAARILLANINDVRKHPEVAKLVVEVTDAITQARRAIDRPADRQYLGQCMGRFPDPEGREVTCTVELWARPNTKTAKCKTCGTDHDVSDRRAWLLLQAAGLLVTAKEASRYIGAVGHLNVTEASIRGLLHRKRFAYRPGTTTFRLGDLLDVLTDIRTKEAA